MSTVFKARDLERASEVVAVKVPLPQYSNGLGSWSMFQREAQIGMGLNHPYVLRFIPLEPHPKRSYVVTEDVVGTTLVCRNGKGKKLPPAEALSIMSRLCEAVVYLQRQEVVLY